jgi:hypothetical protein
MPKTLRMDEGDWMLADQVDCLARLKLEDCFCSGFSDVCLRARGVLSYQASEKPAHFQNSADGPIQFKMIAISAPGIRNQKLQLKLPE